MNRKESILNTFNNCAKEYEAKLMNIEQYHSGFNLFCENINNHNASLLEVGCGPGNVTKYILDRRPNYNILGIDIAKNMITLAKNNNPSADFKIMNALDIDKLNQKFNGIISAFCFPYLSKEEVFTFIKKCSALLLPNGLLYISTMEDLYANSRYITSSSGKNTAYQYFHEKEYIRDYLNQNSFEILKMVNQDYISEGKVKANDLIIIAKKRTDEA
ncbi:class I SAM-dependent DNA methyltransferase [Pseudofulvibacter geojedonensis]|uniref:Class I SAM-dependent DNA methyltransferase n=1 Tax=Pseudofulvibacter geojedonensis TaxID=1123758 RepID=A0ABW3I683_9FLAO